MRNPVDLIASIDVQAFFTSTRSVPLLLLTKNQWQSYKKTHPFEANLAHSAGFKAHPHTHLLVPNHQGTLQSVLVGTEEKLTLWTLSSLPPKLPNKNYYLKDSYPENEMENLLLGWALGHYRFDTYQSSSPPTKGKLFLPTSKRSVLSLAKSLFLGRHLINFPACDLPPLVFAKVAKSLAKQWKESTYHLHEGKEMLTKHWPMVQSVGGGSKTPPCVVDISWGNPKHKKVTLIGKGVTFDTGGLNLKPTQFMLLMKKDMAGGAIALALGNALVEHNLPIRLRVIIPCAENAIGQGAFKPGDILQTREGKTVENTHTDAEGRLILADALTAAKEDKPDMICDFATLTGAARVAVGTEMSALFTPSQKIEKALVKIGNETQDFLHPLPLFTPYKEELKSHIADLVNSAPSPYGGAITAALFLQEFIGTTKQWIHLDTMGYILKAKPGRPKGGEVMSLRALFTFLKTTYQ